MTVLAVSLVDLPMPTVADGIVGVLATSTPAEIAQAVVRRIVVQVSGHHAWRARADERFQYQAVNCSIRPTGKHDVKMPRRSQASRLEDSTFTHRDVFGHAVAGLMGTAARSHPLIKRADQSGVADFVATFISNHRNPTHEMKIQMGSDTWRY